MSQKIGVIGQESFTLGFQLAGVRHVTRTEEPEEFAEATRAALEDPDLGILIVHADDVDDSPRKLQRELSGSVDPVVVQVGREGVGDMRERVKQAIGIDLMGKEDAAPPSP